MKLYSYFRSSAAYRVRIALSLKSIAYETLPVHLIKDGGHNKRPEFRAVNPQMRVPVLVTASGETLIQSLAIIEYLEETHPEPALLPTDPIARAKAARSPKLIACDIHPLNNIGPLRYLKNAMHQEQSAIDAWYHHWVIDRLRGARGADRARALCLRRPVTIADVCLVPQVDNARRLKVPLDKFPKIVAVDAACLALPAFDRARPENQPDAE